MYINAASAISPQQSFRQPAFLQEPVPLHAHRTSCLEPAYGDIIEPKLIRRMSRIIRMGVATGMDALQQAGCTNPDAIITGTAYGCLEDTGIFLKRMVENQEEMLTPTAFIQSTHNTVGAQLALLLKCHSYNNTFVQRTHSFECSLLDADMFLQENPGAAVLVGAADELTDYSFSILERFGLFRACAAGEGACYMMVGSEPAAGALARINGVRTLFNPAAGKLEDTLAELLADNGLFAGDIDLVLSGNLPGDAAEPRCAMIENQLLASSPKIYYKLLCGEYPTASAFGMWLGASVLKQQLVPAGLCETAPALLRHLLIYQADSLGYHSLMLLTKC